MARGQVPVEIRSPQGEERLRRRLDAIAQGAGRMGDPLEEAAGVVLGSIERQMDTEGAHHGTPWEPLSPDYAAWKARHYPGRPILVRTGEMRRRVIARSAVTIRGDRLVYQPDSEVAAYQHFGTSRGIPAHPIWLVGEPDRRRIVDTFRRWIRRLLA